MATMVEEEEEEEMNLNLNRTQDLWATQDQSHQQILVKKTRKRRVVHPNHLWIRVRKIRKQKNVYSLILASKILLQRDVNRHCVHVHPEREKIVPI